MANELEAPRRKGRSIAVALALVGAVVACGALALFVFFKRPVPRTFYLAPPAGATYSIIRRIDTPEGKTSFVEVEYSPATGHEIADLLDGSEEMLVEGEWVWSFDWPPVEYVYPLVDYPPPVATFVIRDPADGSKQELDLMLFPRMLGRGGGFGAIVDRTGHYRFPAADEDHLLELLITPLPGDPEWEDFRRLHGQKETVSR